MEMKTGKQTIRKALALLLALVLTFSLAACGGDATSGDNAQTLDPAEIVANAQEKLNELKSLSFAMTMAMNMSMADQTLETTTTSTMDCINEPLKVKAEMVTDMGEMGSMTIDMYIGMEGEAAMMYMTMDGTNWMKQEIVDAGMLEQYDAAESMDVYLTSMSDFKDAGSEDINGVAAQRYDGVISEEYLNEVLTDSGALDQVAQYGLTQEDLAAIYQDLGSLPASLWVDPESGLPVRYEMDMTEMMTKLMENLVAQLGAGEDAGIKVDQMKITMDLSNFDAVADFDIPAEALNAVQQ